MISTTKTITLFALCIVTLTSWAQEADFSLVSVNSAFESANAVAMDHSTSAIYVGGTLSEGMDAEDFLGNESAGSGIGTINLQGQGSEDCYLAKLSYSGDILWFMTFGSDEKEELFDVEIGPDFNVYITGAFQKDFTIPSADGSLSQDVSQIYQTPDYDMFTASFTPDGVFRWIKIDGGKGNDKGLSLDVSEDGIAILGVYESCANSFVLGGATNGYTSESSDFAVIKRDFSGAQLWTATAGSSSDDFDFDQTFQESRIGIACDGGDVYIVAKWGGAECMFYNNSGSNQSAWNLISNDGEPDIFVAKINSTGEFDWTQAIYSDYSGQSRSCSIDVDCNAVYIGGIMAADAFNWLWLPSGYIANWGDQNELFITALNKYTGIDNWIAVCFDYDNATSLTSIQTNGDGNIVVVGSLNGDLYLPDGISTSSNNGEDALIVEFNSEGTCLDAFVLGDLGETYAHAVALDSYGNCCVVGTTDSNWTDGSEGDDNSFVHAFQLNSSGVSSCCSDAPSSGIASVSDTTPCSGTTVSIELTGYYGNIQWVYSGDNGETWGVPDGYTSDTYTVAVWSDLLIKAIVSLPGCASISSNVISLNAQIVEIIVPTGISVGVNNSCSYTMQDQITPHTTSSCPASGYTQDPAIGTALSLGVNTCYIIDPNGDVYSAFNINVVDDQNPDITCPIDQTILPNISCEYVLGDYTNSIWANDNCSSNLMLSQNPAEGTVVNSTTAVTVYAEDEVGNIGSCSFNVLLVMPVGSLQVSCPDDQVLEFEDDCSAVLPDYTAGFVLTSCGASNTTQSPAPGTVLFSDLAVTLSATAGLGSAASCAFQVTLEDNIAPTMTCPGDQVANMTGTCSAIVPDFTASANASDNCGLSSVVQSPVAGTEIFSATAVTITATDLSGLTSQCDFEIVVVDADVPELICPEDQEIIATNCQASIPDYTLSVASSDNCGISSIVQFPSAGTILNVGSHSVEITSEDVNGLESTCDFILVIADSVGPSFACPDNVLRDVSAECEYLLEDFTTQIADESACSVLTFTQNPAIGTSLGIGEHIIEISALDIWGNSFVCDFLLQVEDNVFATIIVFDLEVTTNVNCVYILADLTSGIVVEDNCTIVSIEQLPAPGSVLQAGISLISFFVTDAGGNVTFSALNVIVQDGTGPQIANCLDDQLLSANDGCQAILPDYTMLVNVSFCTGVEAAYELTQFPAPGTTVSGPIAVVLGLTDLIGNYDECTFNVDLIDDLAPNIDCSNFNNQVNLNANCLINVPNFENEVLATDNCNTNLTYMQSPQVGLLVALDENIVIINLTDQSGNTAVCEVVLNGVDNTVPTATLIESEIYVSVDHMCKYVLTNLVSNVIAQDACGNVTITQSPVAGSILSIGAHELQFDVVDTAGNTKILFADLLVEDSSAPVISICPEDRIVEAVNNCEAVLADYALSLFVMDNCTENADLQIVQTPAIGSPFTGQQEVILEVFDSAGNSSICSFNVTVQDTEVPNIVCPQSIVDVFASANCEFVTEDFTDLLSISDNCGVASIEQNPLEGTTIGLGIQQITFEVTDADGNVANCEFEINVLDQSSPSEIDFPSTFELSADVNCQAELPDFSTLISVGQECSDFTFTQTPDPGVLIGQGSIDVSVVVVDDAGNESVVVIDVLVIDDVVPSVTDAPESIGIQADNDCNYFVPNVIEFILAADNCTSAEDLLIEQNPEAGTPLNLETIVIISVSDAAGNTIGFPVNIVPNDGENPVITCGLFGIEQGVNQDCETTLLDYTGQIESVEDCSSIFLTQNPVPGTILELGLHEIWIIAVDAQSNADSCNFVLEVVDVSPPVVDFDFANQVLAANSDCVATMPFLIEEFMATDNCDSELTVIQFPEAGTILSIGEYAASITYLDDAGNSSIEGFLVIVEDQSAPSVICPDPMNVSLALGCTFQLSDFSGLLQVQDCSPYSISQSPSVGSIISESTEVTYLIVDDQGLELTCSFVITLTDISNPQIDCLEDQVVLVSNSCEMLVPDYTSSVAVTDNCAVLEYTQSPIPGTLVVSGEGVEIQLSAFDNAGNNGTCSFELTFEDTLAPQVSCPNDFTLQANESCEASLLFEILSLEDCEELSIIQIAGPSNGLVVATGAYDLQFLISDSFGNQINCDFSVEVLDVTLPLIDCPEHITSCDPIVFFEPVMVTDNCGSAELTQLDNLELQSGSEFPLGTTEINFQAEDESGNSSFCMLAVTVIDNLGIDYSQFPETMCAAGDEINLSDLVSSDAVLIWSFPIDEDGLLNANDLSSGVNTLSFTATLNTCSSVEEFEIELIQLPLVEPGPNQQVCGTLAELEGGSDASDFVWSTDGNIQFIGSPNEVSTVVETNEFGAIVFTLTASQQGCVTSQTTIVEFFEQPVIPEAGLDQLLSFEYDTQLEGEYTGSGNTEWWTIDSSCGFIDVNDLTSNVINLEVGENMLYLTASNGPCPSSMDSVLITVNDLLIPSGFSPNGDMDNDLLVINGLLDRPGSSLIIFNRWGNEVYSNNNYENDWDGSGKDGSLLPDDTYFMILQAAGIEHRGYLVIKR
jgi:gliding motility-associated-like protein